jgi:hypothetical protein
VLVTESKLNKLDLNQTKDKSNFFTLDNSNKQIRSNTLNEFIEEEALLKVLNFLVDNNLLLSISSSESFKDFVRFTGHVERKVLEGLRKAR